MEEEDAVKLRIPLVLRYSVGLCLRVFVMIERYRYEGWNFNSGNYLFTTDTK